MSIILTGASITESNSKRNSEKIYKFTPEDFAEIMGNDEICDMFNIPGKKLSYICSDVDLRTEDGRYGFIYDDGSCYVEDDLGDPGIECANEQELACMLRK